MIDANRGHEPMTLVTVAVTLFLCLLWGGLTPALKISLDEMPPLAIAAWRFLLGLLVIAGWCSFKGISLAFPKRRSSGIAVLSVIFAFQIAAINFGTSYTASSQAIVLLNTSPLFVAVLAHFFLPGDRISTSKVLGLCLAFAGVAFVFSAHLGYGSVLLGNSLSLLSGFLLALLQVRAKALLSELNPFQMVFWELAPAVPFFFLISALLEPWNQGVSTRLIGSLLYQGIVIAGFCFVVWASILQRQPASKLVAFQFSTPLFGVLLSGLILDENITRVLIIGAILVAAGVYLVSRARSGQA